MLSYIYLIILYIVILIILLYITFFFSYSKCIPHQFLKIIKKKSIKYLIIKYIKKTFNYKF